MKYSVYWAMPPDSDGTITHYRNRRYSQVYGRRSDGRCINGSRAVRERVGFDVLQDCVNFVDSQRNQFFVDEVYSVQHDTIRIYVNEIALSFVGTVYQATVRNIPRTT